MQTSCKPIACNTLQRARGRARLVVNGDDLQVMYQSGSSKIFLPRTHTADIEAILVNTAGGLADGDEFTHEIDLSGDAYVTATTQTAERVYRAASHDNARLNIKLTAKDTSRLHWLPQETILFDNARLSRTINIDLDPNASLLMLEMGVFGRTAMGETLTSGYFNDQWRIHRDGRLIHAEAVLLDGDIGQKLATPAAGGGHISMGTLIYRAGDAEASQTMTREHFAAYADLQIAVSAWQQKLVIRAVASDHARLKAAFNSFLTTFRQAPVPRVWHL